MELEDDRNKGKTYKRKDWGEYRRITSKKLPAKSLVKLLEHLEPGKAIDLGPGSGTDTIYLLEKGWDVLCVDTDDKAEKDIRDLIKVADSLNSRNLYEKFTFCNQDFENLKLEKNAFDLVIGFNSLFFCRPEKFKVFFKQITDSIKSNGYLIVNLLGKNDDWNKNSNSIKTFLSREEILELLTNFEIRENSIIESEFEKETVVAKTPKHWHTFFVIARKK